MMRKTLLSMFVAMFLVFPSQAFAYNTWFGYNLSSGVGNYGNDTQYYFVHSSASVYETSYIDPAWSDWIFTTSRLGITTPISFRQTTNTSRSVVDLYATNGIADDGYAWTEHLDYGAGDGPDWIVPWIDKEDWDYAEIYINNPEFHKLTSFHKKGAVAHEIGHTMGLAHTTTATYIMTQIGAGRTVNSAQPNDLAGINYLY